jgi:hypothetical protein
MDDHDVGAHDRHLRDLASRQSKGRAVREIAALPSLSREKTAAAVHRRIGAFARWTFHLPPMVHSHRVDLNLDANSLLLSLLIGSIGFVCFVYGKRQRRFPQMLAGVVLCVYPYFVTNLIVMSAIAVGVLALLAVAVKLGA